MHQDEKLKFLKVALIVFGVNLVSDEAACSGV